MIIGTAGHIDHGKTALVKALTGVDADRLPEEKRRGITIDLGFAPLLLEGVGTVGVIDVPGHEDFVRSMLVGASGIDLGLLVVAADEGVMPQTREHLLILQLLGVPQIVVALTKSDLVDSDWLELVRSDVLTLFDESKMAEPPIVSCSSRTQAGLDELRAILGQRLEKAKPRATNDLFRMPVDRAFTVKGTGTVVTGTVWSGELPIEANVRVLPWGKISRVRRIEQHGQSTNSARAGGRAAVALAGLDVNDVSRGSVLVGDQPWRATMLFEAVVQLEDGSAATLTARTRLRLHAGASEVGARIVTAARSPGSSGPTLARITTDAPLVIRGGDRFVLRLPAPLRTIGGGVVIDPYARRRPLPSLSRESLDKLSANAGARLGYMLESENTRGLRLEDVAIRTGCAAVEVQTLVDESAARVGTHNLFAPMTVEQVMASVRRIVAEYEIGSPLALGVPSRTLREGLRVDEELADISIREMQRSGEIESHGPLIRKSGWSPSPTQRDVEICNHLVHDICAGTQEPPSVGELVSRFGSTVPGLLRFLERQGRIVQVETDRYYDRGTLDSMIGRLKSALVPGQQYVPAQLRDVLGSSRKYLIPFLEFCDRTGVTERRGEGRVLRQTSVISLDTSQAHS
ncbi:MAG TPA: selenocysteine-specific translation elongation factor [Gemmatimonadaceae bacterium]|nr:selenocysteine-specific translation elongation factor [Gemmatimonadaceae bacterium]